MVNVFNAFFSSSFYFVAFHKAIIERFFLMWNYSSGIMIEVDQFRGWPTQQPWPWKTSQHIPFLECKWYLESLMPSSFIDSRSPITQPHCCKEVMLLVRLCSSHVSFVAEPVSSHLPSRLRNEYHPGKEQLADQGQPCEIVISCACH